MGKSVKRAFLELNLDDEYKAVETDGEGASNATLANCWRIDSDVCDWLAVDGGQHANSTFDSVTCAAAPRAAAPAQALLSSCPAR